jgi:hypothetical protein
MCSEAILTLSLVIRLSDPCGAFPTAKLILCSRSSSSVAQTFFDASRIFFNSGSAGMVLKNCCRSAMRSPLGAIVRYLLSQYSPLCQPLRIDK